MHNGSAMSTPHQTLYEEHLLLGATFGADGLVDSYAGANGPHDASMTHVADVSHVRMMLVSGESASAFTHAAFAGTRLAIGGCAFECVLTGDGNVASIPLLARTGDAEYVTLDFSPRAETLEAWLLFLSGIEHEGQRAFENLQTQDVTDSHVAIALWGHGASHVLKDYLGTQPIPKAGTVCSRMLDRIACIVVTLPTGTVPCYVLLVPPHASVALWRSFLSFPQVRPEGAGALWQSCVESLGWPAMLSSYDALSLSRVTLEREGLIRDDTDYVGARGLAQREETNA